MLAEGVWPGNKGSVLYEEVDLASSATAWNHKPLVVYHPKKNGEFSSACEPFVLNTRKVGLILNTRYDDKLRTECWFDVLRTKSVDERVLTALEKGQPIECSTGLYNDEENKSGTWKDGKQYQCIARNYRPDHLAVLPDCVGAYAIKDGGGILQVNERFEPERNQKIIFRGIEYALKSLGGTVTGNELTISDISKQLSDLLATKFGEPGKYWDGYICDIYPESKQVVFKNSYKSDSELLMIDYKVDGEQISLSGDAVHVERTIQYQTVNGVFSVNAGTLDFTQKEESSMPFDKKAHITALIGHGFEEKDRPKLEKMDEEILEKIKPAAPPVEEKKETKKVTSNQQDDDEEKKKKEKETENKKEVPEEKVESTLKPTFNQLLESAPPELRAHFTRVEQSLVAEKERHVKTLVANANCPWTEESLKKKDVDELRALVQISGSSLSQSQSEYKQEFLSNLGGPNVNVGAPVTESPLVMPNMYAKSGDKN